MQAERPHEIDPTAPVTEQAAGWWLLLNESDATDADRQAFAEWVARSPERVSAYLQAAQAAHMLSSPRMPWPDTPVDELVRLAAAPEVARLPLVAVDTPSTSHSGNADHQPAAGRVPSGFAPRLALAAAAVLAVFVMAAGLWFYAPRTERFETALGEQHSIVLSDGSLVTLNTTSRMELHFSRTQRRITLLAGEALFQVAHDVSRPFEVTTGGITVRAVGTKFNVDRHSQSLRVTVIEGRVEVSTGAARIPLGAGEQLTLPPAGTPKVSHLEAAVATAWTQRQLIFENRPLGEVAAELNRYNRRIIDIQSASLREQQVTGVFQSNDPASFLTFVGRIPGVTIEESENPSRYIVRQASPQ